MSISTFGAVHVAVSLVGIASGVTALIGMVRGRKFPAWIALFLGATVYTSVSGLMMRSEGFGPADLLAVISLPLLMIASFAIYLRRLVGAWKSAYLASSIAALYLNVFACVVAAFQFVPTLSRLTPSLANPPLRAQQLVEAFCVPSFAIVQLALIASFIALGTKATSKLPAVEAS